MQMQEKNEKKTLSTSINEKHIERIWERMTMIFGHKWASSYGERDDGTWLVGLGELTLEQISHGLNEVLKSDMEWPPSLSKFRQMCIGKQSGLTHNTAAYKYFPRDRMLEKKTDKEKARRELQAIREKLI